MHLGRGNAEQVYTMKGKQLEKTTEEKDIGVLIASTLKPATQCQKAARTAQGVLSQIGRAFHYRDRNIFVGLYKQYVRPHLEFSSPAWSPWSEKDKECLENVQKRAVRMVSGLRANSYEDRLKELGLQTLEERRRETDMIQVYKILHKKDKVTPGLLKPATTTGMATRATTGQLNLKIQAARLDTRKYFFTQRVPNHWNALPDDVKLATSVQSFKNGYRNHMKKTVVAVQ